MKKKEKKINSWILLIKEFTDDFRIEHLLIIGIIFVTLFSHYISPINSNDFGNLNFKQSLISKNILGNAYLSSMLAKINPSLMTAQNNDAEAIVIKPIINNPQYAGNCFDSDYGINIYSKGKVSTENDEKTDYCTNSYNLIEFYCTKDKKIAQISMPCENGCSFGKCDIDEKNSIYDLYCGNIFCGYAGGPSGCKFKSEIAEEAGLRREDIERIDLIFLDCFYGNGGSFIVECYPEEKYDVCVENKNDGVGNWIRLGVILKNSNKNKDSISECTSIFDCMPKNSSNNEQECNGNYLCNVNYDYSCINNKCIINKNYFQCSLCNNGCYANSCITRNNATNGNMTIIGYNENQENEKSKEEIREDNCYNLINKQKKEDCYNKLIFRDLREGYECNIIKDIYYKDNCYFKFAFTDYNLTLCFKIFDEIKKIDCVFNINPEQITESMCISLTNQNAKDLCFFNFATFSNQSYYCYKINDNDKRYECLLYLTKDQDLNLEMCNNFIASISKDRCIQNIAVRKNDISLCNKINDNNERNMCYEKLIYDIKDNALCNNIPEQDYKDECISNVAYLNHDETLCKNILNINKKDFCYYNIAIDKEDPLICNSIIGIESKSYCYEVTLSEVTDRNICEKISEQQYKDECYYNIAYNNDDLNACQNITDIEIKEECLDLF